MLQKRSPYKNREPDVMVDPNVTCNVSIFSRATDTKGRMRMALRRVSVTLFNTNNSATNVLPAEVGAEYTRFFPSENEE